MVPLPLALGLVAVGMLTACAQGSQDARSPRSTLAETSWILTEVLIGDGLTEAVDDTGSLTFASGGALAGSTGCNRFTGTWTAPSGDTLALSPGATTLMACPGPLATQEHAVIAALSATTTYRIEQTTLSLLDRRGVSLARFRSAPAGLAGTAWRATGVNNGSGGVVTTAATAEQTLRFEADGSAQGFGGCGRFSGSYESDGRGLSLTLSPEDGCSSEAQQQYVAALQRATTWQVDGNRLELRDDAGALQAGFTATA